MALTARMEADFSSFQNAVEKAQISLRGFEGSAGKVGSALNRMADSFSGRKVIQDATLATAAVDKIGGASKLTASEQARLNSTIGEALAKYKALGQEAPAALREMHGELNKQTVGFKELATAAGAIAGITAGAAAGIAALGSHGANVNDVSASFKDMTGALNESADAILGKLRTATLGNVSDLELMRSANLGMSQGLKLTAEQFGVMGDVSAVLADRIGGDVGTAFDTLTRAMATGQDRTLKTIGLNIDAAAATAQYATELGKEVSALTEAEKKHAIQNAILVEGQRILDTSGKASLDFGDKVAGSTTKLKNFTDGIATWVATSPSVGAWASTITAASSAVTAMGLAYGPVSGAIAKLIPAIGLTGLTGAFSSMATMITATVLPALGTTLAALSPFLVPLAAVAAAVGVVYVAFKNWDKITDFAKNAYDGVKSFMGDQLDRLLNGPVFTAVSGVVSWFSSWDQITATAQRVYDGLKLWIGDNLGTLLALTGPVGLAVTGTIALFENWKEITAVAQRVYEGVKTWMVDKFAAIVESIKGKIDAVTGYFKGMYDAVVGHSFVPDMIKGIASEFAKLNGAMVSPAESAARGVAAVFDSLTGSVLGKMGGMLSSASGMLSEWADMAEGWVNSQIGKLSARWQGAVSGVSAGVGTLAAGGSTKSAIANTGSAALTAGLGAYAAGGTIAGSIALGATTMGVGLAAVGVYKGIKAWMGQNEHKKVNDLRDAWFDSVGGLKGVNEAAQAAGDTNLNLTKAIFGAKKKDDFARAVEQWEKATKSVQRMAAGGFGTVQKPTLFLAGEAGPEQFACSGAGKKFGAGGAMVYDFSELKDEISKLRTEQRRDRRTQSRLIAMAVQDAMAHAR